MAYVPVPKDLTKVKTKGRYIDFTEDDIIGALEAVDDGDVRYFKPTDEEMAQYM